MTETPDKWAIIKIASPDDTVYKILGGFSGGYMDDDVWMLSSGVVDVSKHEPQDYMFKNVSGSIYQCRKDCEGFTTLTARIFSKLQNSPDATVTQIPLEQFIKL